MTKYEYYKEMEAVAKRLSTTSNSQFKRDFYKKAAVDFFEKANSLTKGEIISPVTKEQINILNHYRIKASNYSQGIYD